MIHAKPKHYFNYKGCVPCLFLFGQYRTLRRRPENSKHSLRVDI